MNVSLVAMPWISLSYPSMALGILRARLLSAVPGVRVTDHYGSIGWGERMAARYGANAACTLYETLAGTVIEGIGDWVFANALRGPDRAADEQFLAEAKTKDLNVETLCELSAMAVEFVEAWVDDILAAQPNLVGFTTTFSQNVASLAVANRLKLRRPDLAIVFGGANCDGVQGIALHRNFPAVDFTVRGEGEQALVQLVQAHAAGTGFEAIQGLCWRTAEGAQRINPESGMVPMGQVPVPDYDGWIEQLDRSAIRSELRPILVLESARGCWWGEKSHCTFCGLNGTTMAFRSKPPMQVKRELFEAVSRYKLLDVMMVDNILDARYFDTLLPELAASDIDFRIHYEVKSNLGPEQIDALQRAKIVHIQPGIESLDANVLKLMRKGVSGTQNVALLRESERAGVTVGWNYLYGFPGESAAHYERVIAQMPNLHHLQPPSGATRIQIERFSPFERDPSLGFMHKSPAHHYRWIYGLDDAALEDMVFLFEAPFAGIEGATERALHEAIAVWLDAYPGSSLSVQAVEGELVFRDERHGREPRVVHVTDPDYVELYRLLEKPWSPAGLRAAVNAGRTAAVLSAEAIEAFLAEFLNLGFLFENCEKYVALASPSARQPIKASARAAA